MYFVQYPQDAGVYDYHTVTKVVGVFVGFVRRCAADQNPLG
jgi:hypothetical protein